MIPEKRQLESEINELKTNKLDKNYVGKTLNTPGWYRVANLHSAIGLGTSFLCSIYTTYNQQSNCSYLLAINTTHEDDKINVLGSSFAAKPITKARIVKSENIKYLEIYYAVSTMNQAYLDLALTHSDYIKAMNFEPAGNNETVLYEKTL